MSTMDSGEYVCVCQDKVKDMLTTDSCEYVCVCEDKVEDVLTVDSCEYMCVCVCVRTIRKTCRQLIVVNTFGKLVSDSHIRRRPRLHTIATDVKFSNCCSPASLKLCTCHQSVSALYLCTCVTSVFKQEGFLACK